MKISNKNIGNRTRYLPAEPQK